MRRAPSGRPSEPTLARVIPNYIMSPMTKLAEIQDAIQRLQPPDRDELRHWLLGEETPEMLAAIDVGLHSLATEPTISAEEMRRRLKAWTTR